MLSSCPLPSSESIFHTGAKVILIKIDHNFLCLKLFNGFPQHLKYNLFIKAYKEQCQMVLNLSLQSHLTPFSPPPSYHRWSLNSSNTPFLYSGLYTCWSLLEIFFLPFCVRLDPSHLLDFSSNVTTSERPSPNYKLSSPWTEKIILYFSSLYFLFVILFFPLWQYFICQFIFCLNYWNKSCISIRTTSAMFFAISSAPVMLGL